MSSSASSIVGSADHLVVLIHGLWGNPSHLDYLVKALREQYSKDDLHILVTKTNSSNFTYDGIETGGERITHEIEAEIEKLDKQGSPVRKLSIIGYSLGGLLARYAIGLLYAAGVFDDIKPVNFTTFASPHLGVRTPLKGTSSKLWNVLGPRTLSVSGRQMFLVDQFRDTGRPLLAVLADPSSIFIKGLRMFDHKTLYANIINDRSVVYYTAAIDSIDPYVDLNEVDLKTIPGSEGVLLDLEDPVRRKNVKRTLSKRITDSAMYTVSAIPFAVLLTVFMPFGLTYFLGNAALQSFKSAQRVKLHDSGEAGITVGRYRKTPFLVDEVRHAADRVYRQAASVGGETYLPTPPPEKGDTQVKAAKHDELSAGGDSDAHSSGDHWPTLALTDDQFDMISSLNQVGFKKYKVHISAVRHTHAAIIVRQQWRPGFGEGKVVVKHWVDGFEI